MNKNIGIVSVLFDRGAGNICLQIKQAIQWHVPIWNVSILARMSATDGKKQIKYWDNCFHNNILLYPTYQIDDEDFEQWVKTNKLDIVVFVEEQFTQNLVEVCKKLGVMSCNYVVWENINPAELSYYNEFDALICPTKCTYNLLKNDYQLSNAQFVPWGVDLDIYQWQEPTKKDKPIIFFPAGWGGVNDRKNEDAVIKAFSNYCPRDKMTLHIHTQCDNRQAQAQNIIKTSSNVSIQEMIKYYADGSATLLPSKWEGNCLPQQESMALGRPTIVPDYPPLNERVIDGETGFLIKVKELREVPGIFVKSVEVDIVDFANKLTLIEDRDLLYQMQLNSYKYAQENLDWKENSKKLVNLLV